MRRRLALAVCAGAILAAVTACSRARPEELYLRAFKREGQLEVWTRSAGETSFHLLATYPVTARSGRPGPKRREGDLQVPEGFYEVNRFNPQSLFHLSLGLNYPNAADRILSDREQPGSDIFIHGGAASIGCLPIGDEAIEKVYALAEKVRAGGRMIPVHIFPGRMSGPEWQTYSAGFPELQAFWSQLQPAYDAFEKNRLVPQVTVEADGRYVMKAR